MDKILHIQYCKQSQTGVGMAWNKANIVVQMCPVLCVCPTCGSVTCTMVVYNPEIPNNNDSSTNLLDPVLGLELPCMGRMAHVRGFSYCL